MKRRTRLGLKRTKRRPPATQPSRNTRSRTSPRLKTAAANKIRSTTLAKARGRSAAQKRKLDAAAENKKAQNGFAHRKEESDDDESRDAEIKQYIEKRIRDEETINVKRLTHSLCVGYRRANTILEEYIESGKIQKMVGRSSTSLRTKGSPSQNGYYTVTKQEGKEDQGDNWAVRTNGKLRGGKKRQRIEVPVKSEKPPEQYVKKLRRRAPNGTTRYFRLSSIQENHTSSESGSSSNGDAQVSCFHSPGYLRAHAVKSAAAFKETMAMLESTPTTELKRYQLMGKAILLKCQRSPHLIYKNEQKLENGVLSN